MSAPNGNLVNAYNRLQPGGRMFVKLAKLVFSGMMLLFCFCVPSYAYDDHALISYYSLDKDLGDASVKVEPLSEFLVGEQAGIAKALSGAESWCRASLTGYKPLPAALAFSATGSPSDIEARFFKSLRIDPAYFRYGYLQDIGGNLSSKFPERIRDWKELYLLNYNFHSAIPFLRIKPGDIVPALNVISTASDIPDYGMDIGLFSDDRTALGGIYGFGEQPFGNPEKLMHQQAPFHMPYYHDWLLTTAMPHLKSPYAIYREKCYSELAKVAVRTKHDYWGYYFAGLALHYVEDLSQPYHVSMVPGSSGPRLLWEILKDNTYISRIIIPKIAAQHLFLEGYIYNDFLEERSGAKKPYFLIAARGDTSGEKLFLWDDDMFIVKILAKKASALGDKMGPTIESITDRAKMESEISPRNDSGNYYVEDLFIPGKDKEKEEFKEQCYDAVKLAGAGARAFLEKIKPSK